MTAETTILKQIVKKPEGPPRPKQTSQQKAEEAGRLKSDQYRQKKNNKGSLHKVDG